MEEQEVKSRRGEVDGGFLAATAVATLVGIICGTVCYSNGYDAGVRDCASGKAVVHQMPDDSTVVVKLKEKAK
jgi:hypothetical protein